MSTGKPGTEMITEAELLTIVNDVYQDFYRVGGIRSTDAVTQVYAFWDELIDVNDRRGVRLTLHTLAVLAYPALTRMIEDAHRSVTAEMN
jgi:hypothetical protein